MIYLGAKKSPTGGLGNDLGATFHTGENGMRNLELYKPVSVKQTLRKSPVPLTFRAHPSYPHLRDLPESIRFIRDHSPSVTPPLNARHRWKFSSLGKVFELLP